MLLKRRTFLQSMGAVAATGVTGSLSQDLGFVLPATAAQPEQVPLTRRIHSSGETIPVVGLGSWITFNVGNDPVLRDECTEVIRAFFAHGGRMIDSSPMYGSSQATIGYALNKLGYPKSAFSADKIWTSAAASGASQFADTQDLWGLKRMDLMQVHNLLSWREHLKMLQALKAAKKIRYIGITTSHGRRHRDLEKIMAEHEIDFVQLTYNILDREAEERLLPLARERGISVIVNRPYQRGGLLRRYSGKPLPAFAGEIGATSWAQFLLKFVISHPVVTCAIPATTSTAHVKENLAAAVGPIPDEAVRQEMITYVSRL